MVEITEETVSRTLADGSTESVRWEDLNRVRIITTADGPAAEDVFYVLEDTSGGGCAVPQGEAPDDFIARLLKLDGFDNERMIEAMSSTTEAEFLCWEKDD